MFPLSLLPGSRELDPGFTQLTKDRMKRILCASGFCFLWDFAFFGFIWGPGVTLGSVLRDYYCKVQEIL